MKLKITSLIIAFSALGSTSVYAMREAENPLDTLPVQDITPAIAARHLPKADWRTVQDITEFNAQNYNVISQVLQNPAKPSLTGEQIGKNRKLIQDNKIRDEGHSNDYAFVVDAKTKVYAASRLTMFALNVKAYGDEATINNMNRNWLKYFADHADAKVVQMYLTHQILTRGLYTRHSENYFKNYPDSGFVVAPGCVHMMTDGKADDTSAVYVEMRTPHSKPVLQAQHVLPLFDEPKLLRYLDYIEKVKPSFTELDVVGDKIIISGNQQQDSTGCDSRDKGFFMGNNLNDNNQLKNAYVGFYMSDKYRREYHLENCEQKRLFRLIKGTEKLAKAAVQHSLANYKAKQLLADDPTITDDLLSYMDKDQLTFINSLKDAKGIPHN